MFTPDQVNLSTLPSLSLECRKALPECSGIYFAIDSQGVVQYIGRSSNLRQRWMQHHQYFEINSIGKVTIAWLEVSDSSFLAKMELALIEWFDPPLNEVGKPKNIIEPAKGKVQNRIKKFIEEKGISRYKFWQDTKLGRDTAYRLCNDPSYIPTGSVLDKICATYRVQPGEFLVWLPDDEPCIEVMTDSQISEIEEVPNINKHSRNQSKDQTGGIVLPFERISA